MALTPDQIVSIRRFVGDEPLDADLEPIYARYADNDKPLSGVVLEILETRKANLLASPLQFTVVGEYGQNARYNVEYLTGMIEAIRNGSLDPDAKLKDIAKATFVVKLVPPDPIRR